MPKERLRATLSELHDELQTAPTVDEDARKLLQEVSADIDRVLHDRVLHSNDRQPAAHVATLSELATRFERDHPSLAAAIRQVADALSRVGI